MLVVQGSEISDAHIRDFLNFLQPGDVVVFNNSRVIPARFIADGKYEITLHTSTTDGCWWGLCKRFNKISVGTVLSLEDGTQIEIVDSDDDSGLKIKFLCDDMFAVLERVGKMPLPPYMKRSEQSDDRERYQTVYSSPLGSMAAPTAGLHFTLDLLNELKERKVNIAYVTLHVGLGTFRPVNTENILEHHMHSEYYELNDETVKILNETKENNKKIIVVGTTSVRVLETVMNKYGCLVACSGFTDIFIYPGYEFKMTDALITNFHLPKSTLVMLVSALAGKENVLNAYKHAVEEKYRFFSFGDAMFIS